RELKICITNCRYESVKRSALKYGFKEVDEKDDWNLYWTDLSVCIERVMQMKRYQKINHFPGMTELCRKDLLAKNLARMQKLFPNDYNFFPKSWCLPADYSDLLAHAKEKKNQTYILKPEGGCQGKGIWITKSLSKINPKEHKFCQQYISKPFLIDGYKFDLRIYVLLTSCDPFRIFVYNEGLARFATIEYEMPSLNNYNNLFMHLTNYSINKSNEEFDRSNENGSKRKLSTLNEWFEMNGYNTVELWKKIDDIIIKTLISVHSVLCHNYRTCFPHPIKGGCACFEVLGFDVVLDRKLNPFVLEVNHSPSFFTDSQVDGEVKDSLIYDTLCLINFRATTKKSCDIEDKEKIRCRLITSDPSKQLCIIIRKNIVMWFVINYFVFIYSTDS
ncbi:hypothetical protein HELRODRAFT_66362, partial [Helobdella robusta]|uniref:Tubulin--tyrosine ligase-like protein 9 n=1 Tax=Helobdella robusta TaxID=6412 RepID=T1FYK2_HELRO